MIIPTVNVGDYPHPLQGDQFICTCLPLMHAFGPQAFLTSLNLPLQTLGHNVCQEKSVIENTSDGLGIWEPNSVTSYGHLSIVMDFMWENNCPLS